MGNRPSSALVSQLIVASRGGNLENFEQILADNPRENLKDCLKSCIRTASKHGHTKLVEKLLKMKVNPNKKDLFGWCSIDYACMYGHVDAIEVILAADSSLLWSRTMYYDTPLHIACRYKRVEVVKLLVQKLKKDDRFINSSNSNRDRPLHIACAKGNLEIVQLLLKEGAKKNVSNLQGKRPFTLAIENQHVAIVSLLNDDKRSKSESEEKESSGTGPNDDPQDFVPINDPTSSEAILAIYAKSKEIDVKAIKCVLSGPPRVGKTTFLGRILKRIKNIESESKGPTESTGFERPLVIPIYESLESVPTLITGDWTEATPEHEYSIIMHELRELVKRQASCNIHDMQNVPPQEIIRLRRESSSQSSIISASPQHNDRSLNRKTSSSTTVTSTVTSSLGSTTFDTTDAVIHDDQGPLELFISEFIDHLDEDSVYAELENVTTVYLMDTGGQPEFHEILPIILQGPSLHLVFFNVSCDLQEPIDIEYREKERETTQIKYKSNYNTQQLLHQLLSSLYCISKETSGIDDAGRPIALLLATHVDKLPADQKQEILEMKNDELIRAFRQVEFYNHFLTFPTSTDNAMHQIFMPIDNMRGTEEEMKRVQEFLNELIKNRFTKVRLPYLWVLFHVILRRFYEQSPGVCTIGECKQLAVKCGILEEHVPDILDYIHRHLGTVLYYKNVPILNEVVICDPNVLFKSITYLIMAAFGGKRPGYHTHVDEVRSTGEIPNGLIEDAIRSTRDLESPLKAIHLINLLKHYNVIMEMPPDRYFMPCLLLPDPTLSFLQISNHKPLLIQFKGAYIPVGVFSALVVKLSQLKDWKLDSSNRYRDHVKFFVGGGTTHLISRLTHLEIQFKGESSSLVAIHDTVVESVNEIIQNYSHTKDTTTFATGFYCPGYMEGASADNRGRHFCECIESNGSYRMLCSYPRRCRGYEDPVELSQDCLLWYAKDVPLETNNIYLDPEVANKPVDDGINSWTGLNKIIDWKGLARQLKIKEHDIRKIELECQNNIYEQTVQAVETWKKGNRETDTTVGVFVEALRAAGNEQLCSDFLEYFKN